MPFPGKTILRAEELLCSASVFFSSRTSARIFEGGEKRTVRGEGFFPGRRHSAPHFGANDMGKAERRFFCVFSLQIVKNRL